MPFDILDINHRAIYCSLCDIYFATFEDRAVHIQASDRHPDCNKCARRFANKMVLRNHWTLSPVHNYCSECDVDFKTAAGLRMHVEFSPLHGLALSIDTGHASLDIEDVDEAGWEDEIGPHFFPDEEAHAARRRKDIAVYEEESDTTLNHAESEETIISCTNAGNHDCCIGSDTSDDSVMIDVSMENEILSQSKLPRPAYTCPLCFEIPVKCISTTCGHAFCSGCLMSSLVVKSSCPVCRTEILPKQLRRLSV